MEDRVDGTRMTAITGICDAVCDRTEADGKFHPPEAFFAESTGYRSEHAATISIAGHLLNVDRYVRVADRMFDTLLDERVDGLWTIGWWCEFPIYRPVPLEWKEQNASPNARYTALTLYSLGLHHRITGKAEYAEAGKAALKDMLMRWDPMEETQKLHLTAEAFALAITAWEHETTQFAEQKQAIIDWVVATFPETAAKDFPFFSLIRTMLLLGTTGTKHLETVIKPAFDSLLAEPRWRYQDQHNDFRHITTTDDHVNIRGNGAVAAIMRLYDLAAGDQVFTQTPLYRHLSAWMDGMISDSDLGYGCQQLGEGMRYGMGSPAQYMQLWWLLGGFGL